MRLYAGNAEQAALGVSPSVCRRTFRGPRAATDGGGTGGPAIGADARNG